MDDGVLCVLCLGGPSSSSHRAVIYVSISLNRDAVEFLANEGHIYTTTDETHYKATG